MRLRILRYLSILIGVFTSICLETAFAETGAQDLPGINIIIDDIGYRFREDLRAIALPGPITYAIMPHSPHAREMSRLATQRGKLILVHLPMEAIEESKNRLLGPGALKLDMTREQFIRTLDNNLRSLPEAVGVNNHMGSLLTQHPGHMQWLMGFLNTKSKFYVDSVTSDHSVAHVIAKERHVPYLRRDIFLDNHQDITYINAQFEELIKIARRKGTAIGIGHPHPETIHALQYKLQELDKYGVKLIKLTEIVSVRQKIYRHNKQARIIR